MGASPPNLTVVFDGDCLLCRRSVQWLERRRTHVPVAAVAAADADALARFGSLPGYGDNMIVAADDGRIWVGPPDAYLVVMWAVRGTRLLSYVLSLPLAKSLTGLAFQLIAGNRHLVGGGAAATCERCVG